MHGTARSSLTAAALTLCLVACAAAQERTEAQAALGQLRASLRMLAAEQDKYWQQHRTYGTLAQLNGYQAPEGVTLALQATPAGWAATAELSGWTEGTCVYYFGEVTVPRTRGGRWGEFGRATCDGAAPFSGTLAPELRERMTQLLRALQAAQQEHFRTAGTYAGQTNALRALSVPDDLRVTLLEADAGGWSARVEQRTGAGGTCIVVAGAVPHAATTRGGRTGAPDRITCD